jgi:hypothetical protein
MRKQILVTVFMVTIVGNAVVDAGLFAQDSPSASSTEPNPAKLNPSGKTKIEAQTHKFWDDENLGLFAGVYGARMLDYASTRHVRNEGRNEWLLSNWAVNNRPLFAGIELAGTAASIGVSYLFHRTHHHMLERWVSTAHIGVGAGGSIRNFALQPARVVIVQPVPTKPLSTRFPTTRTSGPPYFPGSKPVKRTRAVCLECPGRMPSILLEFTVSRFREV